MRERGKSKHRCRASALNDQLKLMRAVVRCSSSSTSFVRARARRRSFLFIYALFYLQLNYFDHEIIGDVYCVYFDHGYGATLSIIVTKITNEMVSMSTIEASTIAIEINLNRAAHVTSKLS